MQNSDPQAFLQHMTLVLLHQAYQGDDVRVKHLEKLLTFSAQLLTTCSGRSPGVQMKFFELGTHIFFRDAFV